MSSKVFFAKARARSPKESKARKLAALFDAAQFSSIIDKGDLVAIKVHFGERGSDAYVNPVLVRHMVDKVRSCEGKPFVTDTNTLYSGSRFNAVEHTITAIEHGFNYAVLGAPVIIADGLKSTHHRTIEIGCNHFKHVHIAGDILDADSLIVVSHFKAHELAGFGGAIKNLAMGCTPAAGKKDQHKPCMFVRQNTCVGCSICVELCPVSAICLEQGKAHIKKEVCTGCGECMTQCPEHAIDIDWFVEIGPFMERMTEYAYGAMKHKKGKVGFVNVLLNITPDCDCCPWSDAAIVPDIGIVAGTDPVAVDKASYDLVNKQVGIRETHLKKHVKQKEDKFTGVWEKTNSLLQISYGEKIGLGTATYTLVEV